MITLSNSEFITRHPAFKDLTVETHSLLPGFRFEVNGVVIQFSTHWNLCRHFLGFMAALDPETRISSRLN